jgi:hypothetical protein
MRLYVLFVLGIAGMVLVLNGVVGLCVRNKTGPWKEGGASLLVGAIVAGVSLGALLGNIFSLLPY